MKVTVTIWVMTHNATTEVTEKNKNLNMLMRMTCKKIQQIFIEYRLCLGHWDFPGR